MYLIRQPSILNHYLNLYLIILDSICVLKWLARWVVSFCVAYGLKWNLISKLLVCQLNPILILTQNIQSSLRSVFEILDLLCVAEFDFAGGDAQLIIDPIGSIATSVKAKQLAGRADLEIGWQWCLFYEFLEEVVLVGYNFIGIINVIGIKW